MRWMLLLLVACTAAETAPHSDGRVFAGRHLAATWVNTPYDPARHADTCKVFHHVIAPDGRVVTKGPGGRYPHHRGLFLGYQKVQCGDRTFDFWHCNDAESQRDVGEAEPQALGLPSDYTVAIVAWCDAEGDVIVREHRALRARVVDEATVLDVVVELLAPGARVVLDGDAHHSGHQFRALDASFVPGTEVRYLRPEGAKALGDDIWADCAWTAAVLPLAGGDVTILRVEASSNPHPARWSTRPYGRFGATFACTLEPAEPRRFAWHYAVAGGALDAARCAALAAAIAPAAAVTSR